MVNVKKKKKKRFSNITWLHCQPSNINILRPFLLLTNLFLIITYFFFKIAPPSKPNSLQVIDVTTKTVTLAWAPPTTTGGADLMGKKRMICNLIK